MDACESRYSLKPGSVVIRELITDAARQDRIRLNTSFRQKLLKGYLIQCPVFLLDQPGGQGHFSGIGDHQINNVSTFESTGQG